MTQTGGNATFLGLGIFGLLIGIMMIILAWTVATDIPAQIGLTIGGILIMSLGACFAVGGYGDMVPQKHNKPVLPPGLPTQPQMPIIPQPTTNPFAPQRDTTFDFQQPTATI